MHYHLLFSSKFIFQFLHIRSQCSLSISSISSPSPVCRTPFNPSFFFDRPSSLPSLPLFGFRSPYPFSICLAYLRGSYFTSIFVPHNLLNLLLRFLNCYAKMSSFSCSCRKMRSLNSLANTCAVEVSSMPILSKFLPIILYNSSCRSRISSTSFLSYNCLTREVCCIFLSTRELLLTSLILPFHSSRAYSLPLILPSITRYLSISPRSRYGSSTSLINLPRAAPPSHRTSRPLSFLTVVQYFRYSASLNLLTTMPDFTSPSKKLFFLRLSPSRNLLSEAELFIIFKDLSRQPVVYGSSSAMRSEACLCNDRGGSAMTDLARRSADPPCRPTSQNCRQSLAISRLMPIWLLRSAFTSLPRFSSIIRSSSSAVGRSVFLLSTTRLATACCSTFGTYSSNFFYTHCAIRSSTLSPAPSSSRTSSFSSTLRSAGFFMRWRCSMMALYSWIFSSTQTMILLSVERGVWPLMAAWAARSFSSISLRQLWRALISAYTCWIRSVLGSYFAN